MSASLGGGSRRGRASPDIERFARTDRCGTLTVRDMMRRTRVTKEFHKNFEFRYDKLTAAANTWIFQDFINPTDSVLHFWCGGGYLLNSLVCGDKYGVDASPKYREHAQA